MSGPAPASIFAVELLAELVRRGVRDVVVCPGSRSQALALAAAAAEQAGALSLHVRLDERSAGFFALGVARETGVPAPVIVTSGTAVANLMPAVLEAHEARVPMILLSADRPVELRGIRSNQTTRQAGLLGEFARLSLDVPAPEMGEDGDLLRAVSSASASASASGAGAGAGAGEAGFVRDPARLAIAALAAANGFPGEAPAGPVQLNLAFRDPLSGTSGFDEMIAAGFVAAAGEAAEVAGASGVGASGVGASGAVASSTAEAVAGAGAVSASVAGSAAGPEVAAVDAATAAGAGAATAAGASAAVDAASAAGAAAAAAASVTAGSSAENPGPVVVQSTPNGYRTHFGEWPEDEVFTLRGDTLAVVIAGEGAGPEAEEFAHAAGIPLLAEVVSGARFGREAITAYESLLDDPKLGGLVEQAIVFGHPTLTRQVPALLRRDDVEVVVVDPYAETDHFDPSREARVVRAARVDPEHDSRQLRRWLGAWVVADRELQRERSTVHEPDLEAAKATGYKERNAYARAELAVMHEAVSRELLTESVWRATWPHDRLVLAASRLVRVLDGLAPARRLRVHANRGLAGIDGTVATALGVATASQSAEDPAQSVGTTRVLLGDLALLHDAGSLLLPSGEARPRIQMFVGNDGGGTIFDGLEVASSASREAFDRVLYTPQRVSLAALAEAYGWEYRLVSTRGELEQLLTVPVEGPMLVEVPLAR